MLTNTDEKTQKELEEDELDEILGETFQNTQYRDQQISHLLDSDGTTPYLSAILQKNKKIESGYHRNIRKNSNGSRKFSINSHSSRSEYSHSQESQQRQSLQSLSLDKLSSDQRNSDPLPYQKEEEQPSLQSRQQEQIIQEPNIYSVFEHINPKIKQSQKQYSLQQIKQLYPNFIFTEPSYIAEKAYQEQTFLYNTLKNVNITCMHVGYCEISNNYKIAIGTDDGRIAIFERNYLKPVNIFEAFPNQINQMAQQNQQRQNSINSVKWSKNMELLALSSSNKEFKVYSFKQSISIEDRVILRMRNQPIQLMFLSKQLQASITSIQYISESPIQLLLIDSQDEVWVLNYRKHIISFRPYLSQLPIKFNDACKIQILQIQYSMNFSKSKQDQRKGVLMAVTSRNYVTICVLKPYFEVIMAYDKQKRAKSISKQGYAHISFRKKPLGLLIVWGKFANLLDIQVNGYSECTQTGTIREKIQVKISNIGEIMLPENTLVAGLLTNTLLYQLSEGGIKIYSCTNFKTGQLQKFYQPIYIYNFSPLQLPSGLDLLQQLSQNKYPSLKTLNYLGTYIQPCRGNLFLTTSTSLFSVKIKNFDEYIHNLIENINNWKVGLQMLMDCYKGKYWNYDNITEQIIIKNVQEYVLKYINFLEVVIGVEQRDADRQTIAQKRNLWYQQVTFLFNIVLQTHLYKYLGDALLPRIHLLYESLKNQVDEGLCICLCPFIWLNRIKIITKSMVQTLISENIPRKALTYLLYHIDPQENEADLAHSLNKILLVNGYYLQLIIVNNMLGDFYTPFAVLVSKHEALHIQCQFQADKQLENQQKNRQQIYQLKELIVWSLLTVFSSINGKEATSTNFIDLSKNYKYKQIKNIIEAILPLLQQSIFPILLASPFEEMLFDNILPELYSNKCLESLNDISNKLVSNAQERDLMTEIITTINTNCIKNLSAYWLCVIKLAAKFVIKIDLFMGIRYLTSQNVDSHLIQDSLFKLTTQLEKQFSEISQRILQEYFTQIEHTNYTTLIIVIGKLTHQHLKVVHALISNHSDRNMKLYEYIRENIENMTDKQINNLYAVIYQNLEMFVEINVRELCQFVLGKMRIFKPEQRMRKFLWLIQKEQTQNHQRLSFIETLIQEKRKDSNLFINTPQIALKLKLIYIELLARNGRQNQILNEIRNQEYPIDESLSICRYYGIDDAEAYLLVKSGGQGDITTAIDLYFKILNQKFQHYLGRAHYYPHLIDSSDQKYLKLKLIIEEYLEYFSTILEECIKICGDLIEEYFHVANNLRQIKQQWYHQYDAYLVDFVAEYIDTHIYQMLSKYFISNISMQALIAYFATDNNLSQIDLPLLNKLTDQLMKIILYKKQMYLLTQETYVCSQSQLRSSIVELCSRGYRTQSKCDVCLQHRYDCILVYYNRCRHAVHPSCSEDIKYCILCKQKNETLVQKCLDNIRKIKIELFSNYQEGEEMQQVKLRAQKKTNIMNRFHEFDKMM